MAKMREFNDPFDGRGYCVGHITREFVRKHFKDGVSLQGKIFEGYTDKVCLSDTELDMWAEKLTKELYDKVQSLNFVDSMYVLCFSACKDNDPSQKLMWAHYANGYRGVRIGVRFDNPEFPLYLDSVKYCFERPVFDLSKVHSFYNDEEMMRFWLSNLTTKSTEWAQEQEFRIISGRSYLELGSDDEGNEALFWRYNPQDIVSIDFGCQVSSSDIAQLIELRNAQYPHMTIRQVVLNDSDYGISYRSIDGIENGN